MKFNLTKLIPEVVYTHTHGTERFDEVKLICLRTSGRVSIQQGYEVISLDEYQAKQLYLHLKSVFEQGEHNATI